jgi:uncharacterized protein (TIGR00369 family)
MSAVARLADHQDPDRSRSYSWHDPIQVAEARSFHDGVGMLRAIIDGEVPPPPIATTLDFALTHIAEGEATFEIEPAEFHFNPLGTVHGGVISTVLDSALGCAVQTMLPAGRTYTTVDLNVTFIRPVTVATGRLAARAEIVNVGRRVGTARAELTDEDGKVYATATTSCLIFDLPGAPRPEAVA